MKEYLEPKERVLASLGTAEEDGLSPEEAERRLAANGKNRLAEGKKTPLILRFLKELAEPMTIILLVAAAISGVLAAVNGEFPSDVIIIMAVVVINAVLGLLQESKAEAAIEALQKIAAATSKVVRGGRQLTLRSEDLVVGDVILLEAGDSVPADCRLLECASLKIEEAALTGESVPVEKTADPLRADGDVPLGDRRNMAFMGSTVVYGRGRAVVTAAGMDTEMGKIAGALSAAQDGETPLQKKLGQLSRVLTFAVIGICLVIFAIRVGMAAANGTLVSDGAFQLGVFLDTFMIAVSLAVAAVPEGLATVVTIVLSIGVTNLSRRSAIIRKLTAVETLGCTQIICSDKTGTLTQNKMTVVEHEGEDEGLLASALSLCSDAEWDAEDGAAVGEPTEAALVAYAATLGRMKNEEKLSYPRVGEIPFESTRKMMTTVHRLPDGTLRQYTKGAPDVVLSRCVSVWEGGREVPLDDEGRAAWLARNKAMADRALRVLACAMRIPASEDPGKPETAECGLCLIGLVGMIDPVRPEVCAAIAECRRAGIRPVMITGDHKDTAVAIALQLGIVQSAEEALTGAELDRIPDDVFAKDVTKYSVYARVQPEHKTRIVRAWQNLGKITAMTGDGVNDAPSIKNADIGVGMGITGTDVTKNVADMILADDNFATIVSAVGEGRRIYDNIRRAIQFLLSSNLSEVFTIFFATLLGFTIFQPVHLLWINLITDCLPALSLGMEKPEKDVMSRPPRSSREGIFSGGLGAAVVYQGLLVTAITLASYFVGKLAFGAGLDSAAAESVGTTMAFLTLSMAEICHSFNMRSLRGSLFTVRGQNGWLWGAAALSLLLTTAVIEIPALSGVFRLANLSFPEYAAAFGLAFSIIPLVEIIKLVVRLCTRKKAK